MGCVFMNIIFPYHIIQLAVHELSMRIQHSSSRGLSHSSRDVSEMSFIQSHEFVELLSSKGSPGAATAMQQCRAGGGTGSRDSL